MAYEATFTPSPALAIAVARTLGRSDVQIGLKIPQSSIAKRVTLRVVHALLSGGAMVLVVAATTSGASIRPWQVLVIAVLAYVSGIVARALFNDKDLNILIAALLETTEPLTYKLDDWGVYVHSGQTTTSTPWSAVRRVLMADDFVLFTRGDGIAYVPRAAFEGKAQMDQFVFYAASKLSKDA